jgi:hypothetical protein
MPYRLSAKQIEGIKVQLELEIPPKTIAKSIPCSYKTVMVVRKNLKVWNASKPPKLSSTGPKKLITAEIEQVRFLCPRSSYILGVPKLIATIGYREPIGSRSYIIS